MSAASPTASNADKENDTAEQLQKLKKRGDNYQREVYNGRKKLKRSHAAATDQSSSLAESRVENGQLRAGVGQLMAEVAGLPGESSSLRAYIGSYKLARNEASKKLHVLTERLRRVPGRIDTAVTKAREELSQLFSFTLKEKGVVPDSIRDLIKDLVALDGVPPEQSVTLSSDVTTHKNINLESRRATVINQNTEKQHFFLGIGISIDHTGEKQLEGWEDLIETAASGGGTNNSAHWVDILFQVTQAVVAAAGGISAWERRGEEEHLARHNATLADIVREIGQEEFDEWSDQKKQDVDLFMCGGVVTSTKLECVVFKGALYNRDNAATVSLAEGPGAAARAEDRTYGGAMSCWRCTRRISSRWYCLPAVAPNSLRLDPEVLQGVLTPLRRSLCLPGEPEATISDFLRPVKAERRAFRGNLTRNRSGRDSFEVTVQFANSWDRWQGGKVELIRHRLATCKLLASFPSWSLPPRRKEVQNLMASESDAVSRASETISRLNVQMCVATLARSPGADHLRDPSCAHAPAAPFVPPVVLAQAPFITLVLAAVPATPVPTTIATQPALATADDNRMSDMQVMFTTALSAVLGTKRAREGNEVDDNARNVPHHPSSSLTAPSSSSYTPVPAASAPVSDAPSAPARRPNDLARQMEIEYERGGPHDHRGRHVLVPQQAHLLHALRPRVRTHRVRL
ncbi:hypothetical protein DFH09DRAFT_1293049 [Mycena vulgaris]|nr:hypothetical protein DFH09DRAFT_1293049 [Mycena vulgaris]